MNLGPLSFHYIKILRLIDHLTQSANIPWNVTVEANGWELILHFVKLKMGYAIVNGSCKIPKGFIAIPFSDLPATQYHLLHLEGVDKMGDHIHLVKTIKSLQAKYGAG